jgi:hypothetical protein
VDVVEQDVEVVFAYVPLALVVVSVVGLVALVLRLGVVVVVVVVQLVGVVGSFAEVVGFVVGIFEGAKT